VNAAPEYATIALKPNATAITCTVSPTSLPTTVASAAFLPNDTP
jgi:hypothetical protein